MKVRIASAGTGKTYALTSRFTAALAEHPPYRLAAVTFTRSAAAELKARLRERLLAIAEGRFKPTGAEDVPPETVVRRAGALATEVLGATVTTIHGFFAELLRQNALALGLEPDFLRIDASEAQQIFAEEARAYVYLNEETDELAEVLGRLFAKRSLAAELRPQGAAAEALWTHFRAVLERYARRLGGEALGPSDIELHAWRLLERAGREEALAARIRSRLARVFVDEYQDTSPLQGRVFAALEALGVEVEVVGDPKQSIYAFRNADVEVFREAMRRGEPLPPLVTSWRHDRALVRFLNRYVDWVADERPEAFARAEAPPVEARPGAGPGRVRLQLVQGEARQDALRPYEADQLARWLLEQHAEHAWREMAVLVRSHSSVPLLARALSAHGVPHVVVGGRGFYDLIEVRDLVHAARVALDPRGRFSLAAFLRGPFAGLDLARVERVLEAEDPLAELERAAPEVVERVARLSRWVQTLRPLDFFERMVRTPFLDGESYLERLEPPARANVDQLLFRLASRRYGRLEFLLRDLEELRGSDEAGVPEGGFDAVRIYTMHGSKGLEWPVVAVFDLNRGQPDGAEPFYVRPGSGEFAAEADPDYARFAAEWKERERQEAYRLLYVALSRPRSRLLLSLSVQLKPDGEGLRPKFWRRTLGRTLIEEMNLAAWDALEVERLDVERLPAPKPAAAAPRRAAEVDERLRAPVEPLARPPVYSPSALKAERPAPPELDDEGDVAVELEEAGVDPGLVARTVGILVHYAIGQDWGPERLADLWNQEAVQRLTEPERTRVQTEAAQRLETYWRLLGAELPALAERDEDYAEFPLLLPTRTPRLDTVWEGVIDRLYRVGDAWVLEDYKTDRELHPERYHFQLALYRRAVAAAWGIEPAARLVYLRFGEVVPLEAELLEEAFERGVAEAEQV
ncbi:UvrD-helicase domain-containing protein [Oceanithermus sp.]|uniref:UvrD-helicase domain-containing protein n=1 Tax=Oceanithermus sp. TaxID=2268145 RepID=UPI00257C6EF5|nr:UvrD-helicase domain-containing protein [Oceanithermus sp.]